MPAEQSHNEKPQNPAMRGGRLPCDYAKQNKINVVRVQYCMDTQAIRNWREKEKGPYLLANRKLVSRSNRPRKIPIACRL